MAQLREFRIRILVPVAFSAGNDGAPLANVERNSRGSGNSHDILLARARRGLGTNLAIRRSALHRAICDATCGGVN